VVLVDDHLIERRLDNKIALASDRLETLAIENRGVPSLVTDEAGVIRTWVSGVVTASLRPHDDV